MGLSMCHNLLKKPQVVRSVLAYDLNPSCVAKAQEFGAIPMKSLDDLSEHGPEIDFVVLSLPSCQVSRDVVDQAQALLGLPVYNNPHEITLIDTSTISPTVSREIANRVTTKPSPPNNKFTFADAPVSGGVMGAKNATLTFMVGGPKHTFDRTKPLLECMGKNIFHCGDYGTGSIAKICNNLTLVGQMIGVCEAMNLGTTLGMDPKLLANVMTVSTAKSWSSEGCNPHPVAAEINKGPACRGYQGGFGASLMLKDVKLACQVASEAKVALPVGSVGKDLYQIIEHMGHGNKDFGVMLQLLAGNLDKLPKQ